MMDEARREKAHEELEHALIRHDPSYAANWAMTWGEQILDALSAAEAGRDLTIDDCIAELWGQLCPDMGPEDWNKLVLWVAYYPGTRNLITTVATQLPIVDDLADFEEVSVVLAAGTIRRLQRAGGLEVKDVSLPGGGEVK